MHAKKLMAPVIITIILVGILLAYLYGFTLMPAPIPLRLIGAAVILALIGVSIFVLCERIKEVRSGEEDDLGKY